MELANVSVATGHGRPFLDMKRYCKVSELDNWSMGDFLTVDDLLDFSNEDIAGPIGEVFHPNDSSVTTIAEKQSGNLSAERRNSGDANLLGEVPAELYVPCDDLAELEWLSNFVEESFSSGHSSTHIFGTDVNDSHHGEQKNFQAGKQEFQSASPISVLESGSSSTKIGNFIPVITVPGRARSKRPRCGASFWSTRILSADPLASILESSSTSTVTATTPLSPDSDAFFPDQGGADSLPAKKLYKNKSKHAQDNGQTRRCLHCATQRTPQWRTGPMGPKTLCNACGVRFKSGRLLPEYRPAQSPTFVESIHSNSHRKVLEMRRHKELHVQVIQEGQKLFESGYDDDVLCVANRRD